MGSLLFLFVSLACVAEEWLPEQRGELVRHAYYVLDFNKEHHQANWVYYELSSERLVKRAERKDNFRIDPAVEEGCATLADYRKSGYDRGHLCPAADMSFNAQAMSESFYLSNMSPQVHACNAGVWSRVEAHFRSRAAEEDLHVVVGPVFKDIRGTIGESGVTVPGYFYKILYSPESQQMVAYVVPNRSSSRPISDFACSVDKVEDLTGIDFFPGLPDELERLVEADTAPHAGDPYVEALLKALRDSSVLPDSRINAEAAKEKPSPSLRRYEPTPREQLVLVVAVILLFLLWRILARRGKKKKRSSSARRRKTSRGKPSRSGRR